MTDSRQIEVLMEKYWDGKTSREEERMLKDFFAGNEQRLPAHLKPYAVYFTVLREKKRIRMPERKTGAHKRRSYLSPALKVAAIGLILLAVGLSIDTHYKNERILMQSYSESITDPDQAMEEIHQAFDKISASLAKAQAALIELTDTNQVNPE